MAFRGKADSGDYSGKGYQATYVQAKNLLYLRGDERDSAYCELTPAANANIAGGRMYLDYAAINPKIPSIRELKIGEGGVLVDMDIATKASGIGENSEFMVRLAPCECRFLGRRISILRSRGVQRPSPRKLSRRLWSELQLAPRLQQLQKSSAAIGEADLGARTQTRIGAFSNAAIRRVVQCSNSGAAHAEEFNIL